MQTNMRDFKLRIGDKLLVNLHGGDAIRGTLAYTSPGVVFLSAAVLYVPRMEPSTLDGEARIPVTSIAWMQVL